MFGLTSIHVKMFGLKQNIVAKHKLLISPPGLLKAKVFDWKEVCSL